MAVPRIDVGIVSAGHDVADARLHKIAAAMIRHGLTVEVLGLGQSDVGPPGATVRAVPRRGFLVRGLRAVSLPWRTSARVVFTVDPDVVPGARFAAVIRRRRTVVDVHEDYARLLSDRSWASGLVGTGARLLVRVSTRLAASADLTVVADDHVPPHQARRRLVVENLPAPELLQPGEPDATPRAIYIGDLRTSRGLFDMVETIAAAPAWHLDLVGPVAVADSAKLHERLEHEDVRGRVTLHGRQPPERAWQIAKGAWVGLVFLHKTPAFLDAMPTKLYEYLASGLPVLATPLPRQVAIIEQSGGGALVDGPAAAAATLTRWSDDPSTVEAYSKAALEWARKRFSDRTPYDVLADTVADIIGRGN